MRRLGPESFGCLGDADQRCAEVAFDIDTEGLQRRDIEHAGAGRTFVVAVFCGQPVDRPQKGREGLPGTGGRDDERVGAAGDRIPGAGLGSRRLGKRPAEPLARGGREPVEHIAHPSILTHAADSVVGGCPATAIRMPRTRYRT